MEKIRHGRGRDAELVTAHGKTKTYAQWAKISGIRACTLRKRTRSGMTIAEAMNPTPPKSRAFGVNVPIKHNFF